MAVRRRPALRVTSPRKKPAANAEELKVDSFTYLLELTAAQLGVRGWWSLHTVTIIMDS